MISFLVAGGSEGHLPAQPLSPGAWMLGVAKAGSGQYQTFAWDGYLASGRQEFPSTFSMASWAPSELTALPSLRGPLCSPGAVSSTYSSSSPTWGLSLRTLPLALVRGGPVAWSPWAAGPSLCGRGKNRPSATGLPCPGLCPHRHKHTLFFLCRQLQPSNARRTHCLTLAIADIIWRAGGRERAVVTL